MHNEIHEHSKNMTFQEKVKLSTQRDWTFQRQSASLVFPLARTSGNFDKQIIKNICLIITAKSDSFRKNSNIYIFRQRIYCENV